MSVTEFSIQCSDVDRCVDEAGFDSFPASDPPGWWAGTPHPRHDAESPDPTGPSADGLTCDAMDALGVV